MSIQDELNQIKSAVYGVDVRDAIHDSIKKTYDDASANGNANMEVKMARGTELTLNDRLVKMDDKDKEVIAQLAQTNQRIVTERKRINTFTTLTDGSTTGDAELVDGRVGADNHTYSNIGDAIRGQLNKKISVVNGVIPEEHTINHIITEAVEYGYYYEATAGKKEAVPDDTWWVHPIIPLEPNTKYRKVNCQLALYNADMTFNSYIDFNTLTFTTPSTIAFVGICTVVDVNTSGLYKASEYTGEYVKGRTLVTPEQIHDFDGNIEKSITPRFVKRSLGKNLIDKSGMYNTLVPNSYVHYQTGEILQHSEQQFVVVHVEENTTYTLNKSSNTHIAFFRTENPSPNSYVSGLLNPNTFTTPVGVKIMTISGSPEYFDGLQLEKGERSTVFEPFDYGLDTKDYKNRSITIDKLSEDVANSIDAARTIHIGVNQPYQSILQAMKENEGENVAYYVHTGKYNLVAEYEAYYGLDYFTNYTGYFSSDDFDKGLYLADGVKMIGVGNVEIRFEYTGTNADVHEWFSPINTTQNNLFDGIDITIADGICRYSIHDDYAYGEGINIFRNCTFKGKSFLNTHIGSGFGLSNTYVIDSCVFKNGGEIDIAYHNNVNAGAKNKLIVKDCYCDGAIRGASYGASTEVSEMLVSGCHATAISVINTDDTGHNIDNIELVEWNNAIG